MSLIERLRNDFKSNPVLLRNEAASTLEAQQAEIAALREAVDRGLDWVTDVINEARPDSIMRNNALRDAEIMTAALNHIQPEGEGK